MKYKNKLLSLVLLASFVTPQLGFAANLEVSGWIPYWKFSEGIQDAVEYSDKLTTVHPFSYSIQADNSIKDLSNINSRKNRRYIRELRSDGVKIIPTVMWSDGAQMQLILSEENSRKDLVDDIADLVNDGNYDGVDIDFEAKRAETKEYFSMFLKELKKEIGSKTLSCTIEARTPPDSLYANVPTVIEYSNDFTQIGKWCDVVEIMAYDQGRADIKLNTAKKGSPYAPVSDIDWVKKVVNLALKEIPREKIMLAVPTYGYEYIVSTIPDQFLDYKRQWSLTPKYADQIEDKYNVKRSEGKSGEQEITYFPEESPYKILSALPVDPNTPSGQIAAQQALLFANYTKWTVPVNYMSWSDAGAVADKVKLAQDLGLRGIAIFKIDGGEDENIWDLF